MAYAKQHGPEMMNRLISMTESYSAPESIPKLEGRRMIMVLSPLKGRSSAAKKAAAKAAPKQVTAKKATAKTADSATKE